MNCFGSRGTIPQFGGIAGVVLHPLAQDAGKARGHSVDGGPRTEAANDAEPSGEGLSDESGIAVDDGFLLEGNPNVGRIAAQRLPVESGWRDADNREGMTLDIQRSAEHRGIAAVGGLPGAMT